MRAAAAAGLALMLSVSAAHAADALKVAISHQSSWSSIVPQVAAKRGYFAEQNLDVGLINASGGAETVQAVTSGSVQIATPVSVHAVIAAYAKGAPIRVISNQLTGAPDMMWYVKADGPIKRPEDLNGKKAAYSRPGSVSYMLLQNMMKERNIKAEIISGGTLPAGRTMLMTGQVDASWAGAPFALDGVRAGELRVLFTGDDVAAARTVVSRVTAVGADYLKSHRDVVRRFQIAYDKALHFTYGPEGGEALKLFADLNQMDIATAQEVVKYFGTLEANELTPIAGVDDAIAQTMEFGLIKEPLTAAQKAELIDIVYDPKKAN
jgi:NitT/TauT family transport system substrate-binding protein